ncbi:MAG: hypothetical protein ACK53D_00995 [Pseudanabaena sp.]
MTNFYHTDYRIVASPQKINQRSPLSIPSIPIATPQKSTSDRPSTPQITIAYSKKIKQRSPPQHPKIMIAISQKLNSDRPLNTLKHHDRLSKKSHGDRPLNTSISRSPHQKIKQRSHLKLLL